MIKNVFFGLGVQDVVRWPFFLFLWISIFSDHLFSQIQSQICQKAFLFETYCSPCTSDLLTEFFSGYLLQLHLQMS